MSTYYDYFKSTKCVSKIYGHSLSLKAFEHMWPSIQNKGAQKFGSTFLDNVFITLVKISKEICNLGSLCSLPSQQTIRLFAAIY